jgi:ABC-type multidrug transport system fused ATPase/permease subunit
MFSEYFSLLFSSLDGLNSKRVALKTNSPYYERIFETFSFPDEAEGKTDICGFNDGISVKNISFSYIEGHPVLKNMSFEIKKGDHIAVVGKTGCGKTTLAKLLVGLYKTDSGEISFDGVDIEQIGKKSLYNLIGMVMQDNYLFNMSIRDNLLLANEDASEVDLVEACKKANIYDYIMSLPDGFDTEIGERGVKLSGGQKQRISIAAALLKNPKILILDEATSSLDKLSEGAINDAINNISEEVTVIAITHKPATALKAEKVVVIEDGEITAIGTHNELLNKNKFYNSLMEASNNEK